MKFGDLTGPVARSRGRLTGCYRDLAGAPYIADNWFVAWMSAVNQLQAREEALSEVAMVDGLPGAGDPVVDGAGVGDPRREREEEAAAEGDDEGLVSGADVGEFSVCCFAVAQGDAGCLEGVANPLLGLRRQSIAAVVLDRIGVENE